MKKELRDIFPEPEKERTVSEFLEWYEKGFKELCNNIESFKEELSSNKRDSKNCPTAKRFKEEICALYNLLLHFPSEFKNCIVKPEWGSQPFDVKIKVPKSYDFIEIVTVGVDKTIFEKDTNSLNLLERHNIKFIVDDIKRAIENKKGKKYGSNYALLVYFNNKSINISPLKEELFKQLKEKKLLHGCFEDIFITGFTMGDSVWKLPKITEK